MNYWNFQVVFHWNWWLNRQTLSTHWCCTDLRITAYSSPVYSGRMPLRDPILVANCFSTASYRHNCPLQKYVLWIHPLDYQWKTRVLPRCLCPSKTDYKKLKRNYKHSGFLAIVICSLRQTEDEWLCQQVQDWAWAVHCRIGKKPNLGPAAVKRLK